MMVAAKYEEGRAPSISEFILTSNNSFTKEDILKSEHVMLQTLQFKISQYCSPHMWIHHISVNADNDETRTRMLGTFLAEITLLDCRFLKCKPSLIAAMGIYSARRMLGRNWVSIPTSLGFQFILCQAREFETDFFFVECVIHSALRFCCRAS
jgi:hypothetical protein